MPDNVTILTDHDCPVCGLKMEIRTAGAGKFFLARPNYPQCDTRIVLSAEGTPAHCDGGGSIMTVRIGTEFDAVCSSESSVKGDC